MELEVEKLNDLYNRELISFISKVDFETMAKTQINIINVIEEYFKDNYKGLLLYDVSVLEEKVIENFQYGVNRSKQTINDIHFFHFKDLQEFETKDRNNQEERNKVINSFDLNNSANNFSDLEERIAISIDSYLSRINYDNKNYERYYYAIKSHIKNSVKEEKNKMLNELNAQLTRQSQSLEMKLLEEYKQILVNVDQKVMPNIGFENAYNNNLMPILDQDNSNNLLMPILDQNQSDSMIFNENSENQNNDSQILTGDIIK